GGWVGVGERVGGAAGSWERDTGSNGGTRMGDGIIYWIAYLHFGRINGIGIPCSGPGLCDQTTKAIWALFGLAPAAMFVTGAIMWWNRVIRRFISSTARTADPARVGNLQ